MKKILIVVLILAALAIGAWLFYKANSSSSDPSIQTQSRNVQRIKDINNLRVAVEDYIDARGAYPTQLSEITPTYIASIPSDPLGESYGFISWPRGNAKSYHLWAYFEPPVDGNFKRDDDI